MTNVDDFLEGGGGLPYIKINQPGGKLVGDLIEARLVNERDYDTGKPILWDDGTPRKQLVLDVRIDWDACIEVTTGKDGVKEETGSYYCRYTAQLALKDACQAASVKMSQVGRFALARTADGTPRNPRHAPPQQFVAKVTGRTADTAVDDLLAQPAQAQPAPAAVPAGVSADDLL